jgi:hypothetical protein
MNRLRFPLSCLLVLGGVFFLLKGGSSVYPWAFSWTRPVEMHLDQPLFDKPLNETSGEFSPGKLYLEEGVLIAQLSIPKLRATWAVVEGTSESSLRIGPGHLSSTPLPGAAGNAVIAGAPRHALSCVEGYWDRGRNHC